MAWQNGLQFDSGGNLITTQAPSGIVTATSGALLLDATGALCTSTGTIVTYQNGLPFDVNGYLVVLSG